MLDDLGYCESIAATYATKTLDDLTRLDAYYSMADTTEARMKILMDISRLQTRLLLILIAVTIQSQQLLTSTIGPHREKLDRF